MGTILVNTTSAFSDGDQITSDSLNNLIDDAILNTTAVSAGTGLTVNGTTGVLSLDSSLTGKVLTGGSLNNAPIGASTPNTGAFTTLSASSGYTGNVTGNLTGDVTGNISGNVTGGTGSFTTLTASGDVTFDTTTLKVDSTNNRVGIGIASPSNTLHVENTTSSGAYINYDGQSNTEFGLRIESNAAGGYFESDFATGGTALLDLYANSSTVSGGDLLVARTQSATPVLLVKGSGNVGIGTQSPANALHVVGDDEETSAINTATATALEVAGNGASPNSGGTILFSAASGSWKFAAIKALVQSGSNNTFGDLAFSTRNATTDSTLTERLRIKSNGNVGIGTTPSYKLDVNSGATNQVALFESTDATAYIELADNTGSAQLLTPSSGDFRIYTGGSGAGNLGTSKLVVEAGGNVGIGDDTPSYKLDVNGDIRATGAIRDSAGDAGTSGQILSSTGTGTNWVDNTGGSSQWVTTGSDIYYNTGNVGINDSTPSYKLDVNGTGRFVGQLTLDDELLHNISGTQNRLPGYYAGTYGVEIEQTAQGSTVHIGRSSGNCMNIGADAPASPTQLAVVYFRDTSTGIGSPPQASNPVGNISITDSTIHFNSTSDYRLKENEVDITDGIDRLKQLKPYRFNFTRNPSKVVDGFFAHEVSPVVPESISGEKDQVDDEGNPVYQGIDQSKLVPLLTAALQEAVAKIEALEARVQTLEG